MKLSVVIPCFNAQDTIRDQLEALARQQWAYPWEVLIVDNRSTDNSISIAEGYSGLLPNFRIVDANERQGQAYALNVGVSQATGEAVVFCDADDMVGEGWLHSMGTALRHHDFVACRMDVDLLNSHITGRHGFGNPQKKGLQMIWYPPYLAHAGSGTMGIKRYLHRKVGGFDETLPYLFDTDYCFKIQAKTKAKLTFVPDAIMHIRYRETFRGTYRQSVNYAQYNVFLSRRYKDFAPPQPHLWKSYAYDWKKLVKLLIVNNVRSNGFMLSWMCGRQMGRLIGSLKYSVPPV